MSKALCSLVLRCVALCCVALRCVALRCVALCCVVLCCVVLCCVVLIIITILPSFNVLSLSIRLILFTPFHSIFSFPSQFFHSSFLESILFLTFLRIRYNHCQLLLAFRQTWLFVGRPPFFQKPQINRLPRFSVDGNTTKERTSLCVLNK